MTADFSSIPSATYRLQFHKGFRFADAAGLVDYLAELGISHVYSSPFFQASPGSQHGYDICNHNEINAEIGSREELANLSESLRQRGLGLIADFVPNHMGIAEPTNLWWMDVLENGPSSPHASHFDIDWHPLKRELKNKVLLPILGDQYGRVLERGELRLDYTDGAFLIHYFSTVLPVEISSTRPILEGVVELARSEASEDSVCELESIITAIEHLPDRKRTEPEKIAERAREQRVIKRRLKTLCDSDATIHGALQRRVEEFQAPGDEQAYDALDKLLNAQNYRLSYWRVAGEEINYRRFFDINSLAAIRMELPEVFEAAHHLVFELIQTRIVNGLRIDHVDGLYNPKQYLELVQQRCASLLELPADSRAIYLLVEKILAANERLRSSWQVHGTTGYEFANQTIELLVDETAEKSLTESYQRFTGLDEKFPDIAYRSKLLVMRTAMAGEVNVLGHMLNRLSETNRWHRDFTLNALTTAVREVIASFPVYRTYIVPPTAATDSGRRAISRAIELARRRNPAMERTVLDFLREVLLPTPGNPHAVAEEPRRQFVMKFQQCSSPITAKGVEDTAFYIYNRLVALNEVGGEPGIFGISPDAFHTHQAARRTDFPHSMLATSTHDTKRSEDVRTRIAAISELPQDWIRSVRRWHVTNRRFKKHIDGEGAPDRNEEYLLYQIIVGSWPLEPMDEAARTDYIRRIQAYMEKAIREAKVNSSWIEPNEAWDNAVRDFVGSILDEKTGARFLASMAPFADRVAPLGAINSLSQLLLKATAPGVPDFYQGNEIWDFSLVDPDNRRPVDYNRRQQMLAQLRDQPEAAALFEHWRDGRIKLFVTQRLLLFRREHAELFREGGYAPVPVSGTFAGCCLSFRRDSGREQLLVAAPRLASRVGAPPLGDAWCDTALEITGRWRNLFTGAEVGGDRIPLSELFREFPIAALTPA